MEVSYENRPYKAKTYLYNSIQNRGVSSMFRFGRFRIPKKTWDNDARLRTWVHSNVKVRSQQLHDEVYLFYGTSEYFKMSQVVNAPEYEITEIDKTTRDGEVVRKILRFKLKEV
jgi:hypothetical protein